MDSNIARSNRIDYFLFMKTLVVKGPGGEGRNPPTTMLCWARRVNGRRLKLCDF